MQLGNADLLRNPNPVVSSLCPHTTGFPNRSVADIIESASLSSTGPNYVDSAALIATDHVLQGSVHRRLRVVRHVAAVVFSLSPHGRTRCGHAHAPHQGDGLVEWTGTQTG